MLKIPPNTRLTFESIIWSFFNQRASERALTTKSPPPRTCYWATRCVKLLHNTRRVVKWRKCCHFWLLMRATSNLHSSPNPSDQFNHPNLNKLANQSPICKKSEISQPSKQQLLYSCAFQTMPFIKIVPSQVNRSNGFLRGPEKLKTFILFLSLNERRSV